MSAGSEDYDEVQYECACCGADITQQDLLEHRGDCPRCGTSPDGS